MVFTESPASNTFEIQDIPAIARAAHARGAVVMMDNTWATPLYFRAFEKGVDISIQAGTFLTATGGGRYRNRAWWYAADGRRLFQDKLQLTGFEKQLGVIDGGEWIASGGEFNALTQLPRERIREMMRSLRPK